MQRITTLVFLASLLTSLAQAGDLAQPVIGGTNVRPGEYPDVVGVLGADGSMCTGTLIAADLVLTAGHCIDGDPIEVIAGSVDLSRPDGDHRRVKWARAFPEWSERYDIGIVMLENPVAKQPRAIAEDCATAERFTAGTALRLVGFGLTTKAGTGDNTRLHQAVLPLADATCASDPSCNAAVAPGGEFTAGGQGTDSCFGDSGGPVMLETASGLALIGVVSRGLLSWGDPCGGGGVYVRADKVVAWIEKVSGRKLRRASCSAPTEMPEMPEKTDQPLGPPASAGDASGCDASGGAHGIVALYCIALGLFAMRRRRRAIPLRDDSPDVN